MKKAFSHYAIFILAAAFFCSGCSKNSAGGSSTSASTTPSTISLVSYPSQMVQNITSQSSIVPQNNCIQWNHQSANGQQGQAVDTVGFFTTSCPTDGSALSNSSLAFSTTLQPNVSGGATANGYQLIQNDGGGSPIVVGQISVDSTTGNASLQELCQFTATNQPPSMYSNNCYVLDNAGSFKALYLDEGD